MAEPLQVTFVGGALGHWRIERIQSVTGEGLPRAERLSISEGVAADDSGTWRLRGVASHARYATGTELSRLQLVSPSLDLPAKAAAALIPIKKSAAWWSLGQDERRAIFEEDSQHIARSMRHLPAVARRLHHARDLGERFDFLTWFEYPQHYATAFEDLVGELRATEEWRYVVREVDVRLTRDG